MLGKLLILTQIISVYGLEFFAPESSWYVVQFDNDTRINCDVGLNGHAMYSDGRFVNVTVIPQGTNEGKEEYIKKSAQFYYAIGNHTVPEINDKATTLRSRLTFNQKAEEVCRNSLVQVYMMNSTNATVAMELKPQQYEEQPESRMLSKVFQYLV